MRLVYIAFYLIAALNSRASAQYSEGQGDALPEKSRLAKQALTEGRYGDAVDLYRQLVKALPGNSGLRFNLAVALDKAGQPSAAIAEAERVTRANPSSAPAWLLLGLAYQQLNQPTNAIAPLRQAIRLDPKNSTALLELGDAELTTGDPRDGAKHFSMLTAAEPEFSKAWEGLGRAYLSLNEASAQQIQRQASESPYFSVLLARSRAAEERYAEALSLYANALGQLSDLPGLHAARAEIYRETKHEDWAAIEDERESHVAKPDCSRRPAACAYLADDWQSVVATSSQRPSPEGLYWTALASSRLAEESFRKLASLPQSPEMHAVLADSYQRLGHRLDAVAEWRKALDLKPADRLLQARLAESLVRARAYPEAQSILTALVAGQPENGELQYLLGNVLLQLKQDDEALPHLVAATNRAPDLLPAQEALGRVYLDLDKPAEAIALLEKARSLDEGSISFALSSAYRKLGRTEEARAALARYQASGKQKSATPLADQATISPP